MSRVESSQVTVHTVLLYFIEVTNGVYGFSHVLYLALVRVPEASLD